MLYKKINSKDVCVKETTFWNLIDLLQFNLYSDVLLLLDPNQLHVSTMIWISSNNLRCILMETSISLTTILLCCPNIKNENRELKYCVSINWIRLIMQQGHSILMTCTVMSNTNGYNTVEIYIIYFIFNYIYSYIGVLYMGSIKIKLFSTLTLVVL